MPLPTDFSVNSTTTLFEPFEEGVYEAVIGDITHKGERTLPFKDEKTGLDVVRDEIEFRFDIESEDRPFLKTVSNSWSTGGQYQPSTLYTICKAAGLAVTNVKPDGSALNELIGRPIQIVVKNKTNASGVTRSNITEYLPSRKSKSVKKSLADEVAKGLGDE